jgi:hypothetical protein
VIDQPVVDVAEEPELVSPETPEPIYLEILPMPPATNLRDVVDEVRSDGWSNLNPSVDRPGPHEARIAKLGWILAGVFLLVAVAEAVTLARRSAAPAAVTPLPVSQAITIESLAAGDAVIVNGQPVGVTPFTLTLTPELQSLQVQSRSAPPNVVNTIAQAQTANRPAAAAEPPALAQAARDRRGGVELVAPVEVQVLEGDRVLGSSADGPIVTTVGRHELDLINPVIGYRSRQVVDIKPGRIEKVNISLPDGRVSINAVPWAQVLINGRPAGDTPLANLPMTVGEHQITFRHPQFGEQTQRVIVKSGVLTRVSATFAR